MLRHPIGRLLVTIFILKTCSSIDYSHSDNPTRPQVNIPQGRLTGTTLTTRHGRNISAFISIPFAQPPIGNLRFANPVAAKGWNGTLDATVKPNRCPENIGNGIAGNEDCLYLQVYTPQLPRDADSTLLPVMVYIHGGGFRGNFPGPSGPKYLLDANVVLVTMNYRLGPLGFLSTGDQVAPGNWGLKDQVLALKWVQDNIRYFGGDPDEVTIFGESAGAGSVHLLTLSKSTIGLFHRYITQSGSAFGKWAWRPKAAYSRRASELGEFVGCRNDTSDSLINCLRDVDFIDILATKSQFKVWEFLPDVTWGPTDELDVEGAVLTDRPSNLFAAGKIRDLPWMNGVTRDEGLIYSTAFYGKEEMLDDFLENIDTVLPHLLYWKYDPDSEAVWTNATKSYYFNNDLPTNRSLILKNLTSVVGDVYFYYPAYDSLQKHNALAANPQYVYSFNYRGTYSFSHHFGGDTADYGVSHCDELIYLFPKESEFLEFRKTMSRTDNEMIDTMVQLWTSFATSGKPTASALGDGTWEPYSKDGNYLRIGNDADAALELQYSFYEERVEFWAKVYGSSET